MVLTNLKLIIILPSMPSSIPKIINQLNSEDDGQKYDYRLCWCVIRMNVSSDLCECL